MHVTRRGSIRLLLTTALVAAGVSATPGGAADVVYPATPGIACDAQSLPETIQGYVPSEDFTSGRARRGYTCNATLISSVGLSGGFRVERYVDSSGRTCAYYDSSRLFPVDSPAQVQSGGLGVYVLDMTDPAHPQITDRLTTPAMVTPHESLRLNQARGLLVADVGMPATYPTTVDVYDVSKDCRHPVLDSVFPAGLGHESGFAPDGKTFYISSNTGFMSAVDLTDPANPNILWTSWDWHPHGLSVSNDGRTLFLADNGGTPGLTIVDASDIQERRPNPQVTLISHLTWPEVSIPQNATPFEQHGHEYVVETDEYGGGNDTTPVGAGRIINVDDLQRPYVVSRLRLQVHNMPTTSFSAHYCTVPSRIDPYIIACGMINSGLRVFDIRDIAHPVEVAYANLLQDGTWLNRLNSSSDAEATGSVFSAPAYDPTRNDIWYDDGLRGFYVVHLTEAAGIKRFARTYYLPGS